MFYGIDALLVCLVILVLLGAPVFRATPAGKGRLKSEQEGLGWAAALLGRFVYTAAFYLLLGAATLFTWAAFFNPDLAILALPLDALAAWWVYWRCRPQLKGIGA